VNPDDFARTRSALDRRLASRGFVFVGSRGHRVRAGNSRRHTTLAVAVVSSFGGAVTFSRHVTLTVTPHSTMRYT
jgi:hypothetical protein